MLIFVLFVYLFVCLILITETNYMQKDTKQALFYRKYDCEQYYCEYNDIELYTVIKEVGKQCPQLDVSSKVFVYPHPSSLATPSIPAHFLVFYNAKNC